MTYRSDSDFPLPYGSIVAKMSKSVADASYADVVTFGRQHGDRFAGKKGIAAWFVSNCKTASERETVATAIKASGVDVDVFGACGAKSCPRSDGDECWKMVERDYLFYLAFENSICNDYVTEKFFDALKRDVVPVVLGTSKFTTLFYCIINQWLS